MDRFGIANTAVNQRNKIMENRKIFIRAECAPSGTCRADRVPGGRCRSCRRSGPDGAMRFSEFRRSVEPFRTGCSRQRSVCPKRTGRSPPPPGLCRSAAPPRGVRSRAARPGTDAARSQLSGTGRANMAEILACRGADAPTARPPLARQPLPRRAAFRCSPPFPVRCIPGGIPPYPAAKSRNRTFVPLPTTV